MEQEEVEIEIFYFNKEYFYQYLDDWRRDVKNICPNDCSWDYFFVSKNENHKIEEFIEYDGLKFLILENDIIWYETISGFKDGEFYWVSQESRLFSLRSIRERNTLYKNIFNIRVLDSFSELYKILDRNDNLRRIGIE